MSDGALPFTTDRLLVADGAWGTLLQSQDLPPEACPELWNISRPEAVTAVARAYEEAGADLVLTDTFGGTRSKLSKAGCGERVVELNRAGAANSRAAVTRALVAGSVGPCGEFLEPLGSLSVAAAEELFAEQIGGLVAGGIDCVAIETMSAIEEATAAVRAARRAAPELPVMATMTFDQATAQGPRTMMGVAPQQAAEELAAAGAAVIGANCGAGPEQMCAIASELRAASDLPILIKANAGRPELVDGATVFRQTPEAMAALVPQLISAGATIIGGCCGTTPAHIRAIRAAVDAILD